MPESHLKRSLTVTAMAILITVVAILFMQSLMQAPHWQTNLLVSNATDNPSAVRGKITVWSWGIAAKSLDALVDAFSKQYPNVSVDVDMTGANMQSRFFLSLTAGVGAPEVSQLQIREAPRYAATDQLADLTSVAMKYKDRFPPSFWANCEYNGRVYAIPWDMGPCAVYYKQEVFEQYGVDPNTIVTWDDYIDAGKRILERSGGRTRMLPLSTGSLQGLFEIMMQQNGAQMFDDEGRIAINSLESHKVLRTIKRMLESGICYNVIPYSHEFLAGFKNDTVATYPSAVWFGGSIKDTVQEYPGQAADWRVFPLPALETGGLRTSTLGGSVLVIPRQVEHKEAAWAFIEYALCTVAGQIAQYRNFDLFPAYLPALEDPFIDEQDPFYGNQLVRRLFTKDLTEIPTLHRTRDWMQAENYLKQALSKWASNGMESHGFFEDLEQKLHSRIGRPISPASQAN